MSPFCSALCLHLSLVFPHVFVSQCCVLSYFFNSFFQFTDSPFSVYNILFNPSIECFVLMAQYKSLNVLTFYLVSESKHTEKYLKHRHVSLTNCGEHLCNCTKGVKSAAHTPRPLHPPSHHALVPPAAVTTSSSSKGFFF